nr:LptF/LptG family permease [Cochlodiniinecator piscidefendens]
MLSQLMMLFGFFSLILVMVYWVNQAVVLFDQLIADGQSATVFLEFTALTLPNVIRVVLPISAFIAAVYATNRLSSESELVVMQATGFSGFRLARPVLYFGLIVAALLSVLSHFLEPMASRQLEERRTEIAQNVSAGLLSEGEFLHPATGITFYIREITPVSELLDIFLTDTREENIELTYSARRAFLANTDAGPKLLMFDGLAMNLDRSTQRLFTTRFEEFAFDISGLVDIENLGPPQPSALTTFEILSLDITALETVGTSRSDVNFIVMDRIAQPLLAVVTPLVGFACLLLGGFSRFGIWRQIILAIAMLVVIKAADNSASDIAISNPGLEVVMLLPSVMGVTIATALLWLSAHPTLFSRRRRTAQ